MNRPQQFLSTVTALVAPGKFEVVQSFASSSAKEAWKRAFREAREIASVKPNGFGYAVWDINRIVERETARPFNGIRLEWMASDFVRAKS